MKKYMKMNLEHIALLVGFIVGTELSDIIPIQISISIIAAMVIIRWHHLNKKDGLKNEKVL